MREYFKITWNTVGTLKFSFLKLKCIMGWKGRMKSSSPNPRTLNLGDSFNTSVRWLWGRSEGKALSSWEEIPGAHFPKRGHSLKI